MSIPGFIKLTDKNGKDLWLWTRAIVWVQRITQELDVNAVVMVSDRAWYVRETVEEILGQLSYPPHVA